MNRQTHQEDQRSNTNVLTIISGGLEDRVQTPGMYFPAFQPKQSFARQLEQDAKRIIEDAASDPQSDAIVTMLWKEIALVMDQIDRLRLSAECVGRSLLQNECFTNTELMQMELRTPRYSPYRFPEREKLQRRLLNIDRERRRFIIDQEMRLQSLHDRLFTLMTRHEQLK